MGVLDGYSIRSGARKIFVGVRAKMRLGYQGCAVPCSFRSSSLLVCCLRSSQHLWQSPNEGLALADRVSTDPSLPKTADSAGKWEGSGQPRYPRSSAPADRPGALAGWMGHGTDWEIQNEKLRCEVTGWIGESFWKLRGWGQRR